MRTDHDLASDPTFEPDRRPRRVLPLVLLALAVGALGPWRRGGVARRRRATSGGRDGDGGQGDGGQEPEAKPAELVYVDVKGAKPIDVLKS